jgi:hypothetical protein
VNSADERFGSRRDAKRLLFELRLKHAALYESPDSLFLKNQFDSTDIIVDGFV